MGRNVGIMENWNNGFGGFYCWADGNNRLDCKIKIRQFPLKTNIPSFHYSIIP
jgi:hypothetical protein